MNYNNIELYLLKLLFSYSNYIKYSKYLRKDFLEDNNKELAKLFQSVSCFHEQHPNTNIPNPESLAIFHLAQYPATTKKERDLLQPLIHKLCELEVDEGIANEYLDAHAKKVKATELAIAALEFADGKSDYQSLLAEAKQLEVVEGPNEEINEFVSDDLEELYQEHFASPGLRWRLNTLNQMLGSLRKGNFGFIFKRPETGGTTLLASEVSFMAKQADTPAIWFNNEQPGGEVKTYIYRAHFGISLQDLFKNRRYYSEQYRKDLGESLRLYDSGSIHRRDVERLCSRYNPSLIVFDQIDKIKGFQDDRHDLELKEIYQWARELAKSYGPVIGVCQAGGTAEGKKWLTMDDVDSSKTSKQGEADWILGIGKSNQEGMENIRHFHLCKNKLIGDEDTIPELRHGKRDVLIRPEIARYEDIA